MGHSSIQGQVTTDFLYFKLEPVEDLKAKPFEKRQYMDVNMETFPAWARALESGKYTQEGVYLSTSQCDWQYGGTYDSLRETAGCGDGQNSGIALVQGVEPPPQTEEDFNDGAGPGFVRGLYDLGFVQGKKK